jgi:hypothetical protein
MFLLYNIYLKTKISFNNWVTIRVESVKSKNELPKVFIFARRKKANHLYDKSSKSCITTAHARVKCQHNKIFHFKCLAHKFSKFVCVRWPVKIICAFLLLWHNIVLLPSELVSGLFHRSQK